MQRTLTISFLFVVADPMYRVSHSQTGGNPNPMEEKAINNSPRNEGDDVSLDLTNVLADEQLCYRVIAGESIVLRSSSQEVAVILPWRFYKFLEGLLANYAHERAREVMSSAKVGLRTWEEIKRELDLKDAP